MDLHQLFCAALRSRRCG